MTHTQTRWGTVGTWLPAGCKCQDFGIEFVPSAHMCVLFVAYSHVAMLIVTFARAPRGSRSSDWYRRVACFNCHMHSAGTLRSCVVHGKFARGSNFAELPTCFHQQARQIYEHMHV